MANIFAYFNTFIHVLFGSTINILTPSQVINSLSSSWSSILSDSSIPYKFFALIGSILSDPILILSIFIWFWFGWLSVNLLLIFPFKWIRSVIRKCRLS